MSDKAQRPPEGQPWIWQTRELRSSDAWRSQSINARRFIDFLMLDHMSKGGEENGNLKAPYRQLEAFGIGIRLIAATIAEADRLGLVNVRRGRLREATRFGLTWLPLKDGPPASNRWRDFRNPDLAPLPQPKKKKSASPSESSAASPSESRSPQSASPSESRSPPKSASPSDSPSKKVLTKAGATTEMVVAEASTADAPLIVGGWRVPDCWMPGPQFRPALSDVAEVIAAMHAGKPAEPEAPVDHDAWLRDGFYSLRLRAGARRDLSESKEGGTA